MGRKLYYMTGEEIPIVGGDPDAAKAALAGKVLIAFGDSFTVGMCEASLYGGTPPLVSLCKKYGLVLDKRGVTGSEISLNGDKPPMVSRVDTIVQDYTDGYAIGGTTYTKDDVAVITFMGGVNDGASNGIIGTGLNATDLHTINGALHHIFYSLLNTFTNAKIICIAQPAHYALSASSTVTTEAAAQELGFDSVAQAQAMDNVQFSSYCCNRTQDAVKKSALMYGVELIDMIRDMPPISIQANRAAYWADDKLHLTIEGYTLITNAIEKKLLDLFG